MCGAATPREALLRLSSAVEYYTAALAQEQCVAQALSRIGSAAAQLHNDHDATLSALSAAHADALHRSSSVVDAAATAAVAVATTADISSDSAMYDAVVTTWLQSLCTWSPLQTQEQQQQQQQSAQSSPSSSLLVTAAPPPAAVTAAARVLATSGALEVLRRAQQRVVAASTRQCEDVVRATTRLRRVRRRLRNTCAAAQRWLLQAPQQAVDVQWRALCALDAVEGGTDGRAAVAVTTTRCMQHMATLLQQRSDDDDSGEVALDATQLMLRAVQQWQRELL